MLFFAITAAASGWLGSFSLMYASRHAEAALVWARLGNFFAALVTPAIFHFAAVYVGRERALRRVKKIGNAHIFEAAISRNAAQRRLIDELLSFFGGRPQPVVAHLVETGKLTLDDVQEAEQLIRKLSKKEKPR